jgi:hypothetical protein
VKIYQKLPKWVRSSHRKIITSPHTNRRANHVFSSTVSTLHIPWNKGKLIGQRPPLKKQEIWSIRVRLQLAQKIHDLALFNLAIDSILRGCDLVKIRIRDISAGSSISSRAMVIQQKTHQPVQFEITEQARLSEIPERNASKPLIATNAEFLFSLVAGSRLAYTANCATRDPRWIKGRDAFALIMPTSSRYKKAITFCWKLKRVKRPLP